MELIDKDKLKAHYSWWGSQDADLREQKRIFDDIVDLQPVVESRPKGKWICYKEVVREPNGIGYEVYYECSNCHDDILGDASMDFCPNCGADMRGEE